MQPTPPYSHYLPKSIPLIDGFLARLELSQGTHIFQPLITIIGPTATGKSDLAVSIAQYIKAKYNKNCEIISADSRQIYRHLNIGTGKITPEEMQGIPHHMLDIKDPSEIYSVAEYQKDAKEIISKIHTQNNIPILVGGTGQYIDAVIYDNELPPVPPNPELRKELEEKTLEELLTQFQTLNKNQAHQVDLRNKRRVIRAIEILKALGYIPLIDKENQKTVYTTLIIGVDTDDATLRNKIKTRLEKRLDQGMVEESEKLLASGALTCERMQTLGLEYAYISDLLNKKIDLAEFKETLFFAIWHYAKRQRTWFRRMSDVFWITNL